MQGNFRHIFLNLFIMLAVIGAGISPACKFISGQSTWMEICGADGIKKILLPAEDVPDSGTQDHARADPCAFCLTHSSVKVMAAASIDIAVPVRTRAVQLSFLAENDLIAWESAASFPRGPPVIL